MVGKLLLAGIAAAAVAQSQPTAAPSTGTLRVQWEAEPSDEAGKVQLSLRHRTRNSNSHNSSDYALRDLEGLDPSREGPVRFRMVREAGTLDCSGNVRAGRGSGDCVFAADSGYAAALDQRGIDRPSIQNQYQLALQDVRIALVDELERQGYREPDVDELVALGIHGADLDYLRALDDAGFRADDPDKLVAMRIHGVSPDFIAGLRALGGDYARLDADDLVNMRIHGVSLDFIRELAALGYPAPSAEDLVSMRIHGVTAEFIRGMFEAGYRDITAEQLIQLRIHGVTPEDARQANARIGN